MSHFAHRAFPKRPMARRRQQTAAVASRRGPVGEEPAGERPGDERGVEADAHLREEGDVGRLRVAMGQN